MATHYRKRHANNSRGEGLPKRLAILGCAFIIGYLSASLIDLRQLSNWLNTHSPFDGQSAGSASIASKPTPPKPKLEFYTLLTSNHGATVAPPPPSSVAKQSPNQASDKAQKPMSTQVATTSSVAQTIKLTTPVASISKVASSPPVSSSKPLVARVDAQPMKQPHANKLAYSLQVAAFRTRQDAEHMKASLLLKGFDASIIAIESQHVAWYRVMVGPFASREQAQRTQALLVQRERMNGMIRKMDA